MFSKIFLSVKVCGEEHKEGQLWIIKVNKAYNNKGQNGSWLGKNIEEKMTSFFLRPPWFLLFSNPSCHQSQRRSEREKLNKWKDWREDGKTLRLVGSGYRRERIHQLSVNILLRSAKTQKWESEQRDWKRKAGWRWKPWSKWVCACTLLQPYEEPKDWKGGREGGRQAGR